MTQLRDLENTHHEKVSDIAVVTLEKMMKNELEEDLPDDLRMVGWLLLFSRGNKEVAFSKVTPSPRGYSTKFHTGTEVQTLTF